MKENIWVRASTFYR